MNLHAPNSVAVSGVSTIAPTVALSGAEFSVPPPGDHFVSASTGTPHSERVGWKTTLFGPALLSPLSVMVVAGGLVMAKLLPRSLSQLIVATLGTIWALDEAIIGGNWVHAFEIYLSGVAPLRVIHHANIQPLQRLREGKKKETSFIDYVDVTRLPRLKDLYGRDSCYTTAVDQLQNLLRRYPEVQCFFGLNPERHHLLDEIGWVRVADRAFESLGLKLTSSTGVFVPFEETLYSKGIVEVAVHELAHVLHFSTIRRRLTFPDLQRILKYFEDKEIHPRFLHYLESVQNFMRGKKRSPRYIPEEVRHAATVLVFLIGKAEYEWYLESVPSFLQWRLDRSVRQARYRILFPINKPMLWLLAPMAWLGGVLKTTKYFVSLAYDNLFILRRALKLGPVDSLLGPNPRRMKRPKKKTLPDDFRRAQRG